MLFICSGGIQRSPTFAKWANDNTEHKARSTGLWNNPNYKDFKWADKIFAMDISHKIWIAKFRPELLPKTEVIGVSDQYQPDEEELIEIVKYWYEERFKNEDNEIADMIKDE